MPDYQVGPPRRDYVDGYPADAFAVEDRPPYPREWTSEQRLIAYWYTLGRSIHIPNVEAWRRVLADAHRTAERHQTIRGFETADPQRGTEEP